MAHPLDADGYRVRRWLRQEPWGPSYLGEDPDGDMVSVNALELKRLGISFDHEDSPDYQRLVQAIKSVPTPVSSTYATFCIETTPSSSSKTSPMAGATSGT